MIEFESMDETFDDLVERLENIRDDQGGEVDDDDRNQRVAYERDGVTFTFDLKKRRVEISFGQSGALELVDVAQRFRLGIGRASPMLAAPPRSDTASQCAGDGPRPGASATAAITPPFSRRSGALELVDVAQRFRLGIGRASPMLAAPPRSDTASSARATNRVPGRQRQQP